MAVVPWKGRSGEEEPSSHRDLGHRSPTALLMLLFSLSIPSTAGVLLGKVGGAGSQRHTRSFLRVMSKTAAAAGQRELLLPQPRRERERRAVTLRGGRRRSWR